ncbi:MAG: hypothetical protein HYR48_04155 [Gemmatimonadetes bacterium]|nr:hypothetical protein [Gemmatimonadota bacterium]
MGALTFILLALGSGSARAWRAYHLNWLYWTGLSQAGILFSAVTKAAKGRWSYTIRRFAEASAAFLPVSFVLFLVLWIGRAQVFPWIAAPIAEPSVKAFWLRDGFMFSRDIAALLLMYGMSFWFLYHSLRPDAALLQAGAPDKVKKMYAWLAKGFDQPGRGVEFSEERQNYIAPGLVITYALVMTFLAFDLIMSLAPHWISNLLGGFFFMGAWLTGLMSLALLTIFWRKHLDLEDLISTKTLHDIGKLCFGFTVFWAYLFFSQFLVIWYGNMPEETSFLFLRMASPTWRNVSTLMVVLVFLVPFWGLIGVKPKQTPAILGTFATISLVGVWLDRYVLTVPSVVQHAPRAPLGWQELLITVGFFGLWGLAYVWFAERFPMVSPTYLERGERRRHAHASF